MHIEYLVSTALCLTGLAIRTAYEALKKSGKIDPENRIVFGIVFMGMSFLLLSWPALGFLDPMPLDLPLAIRRVGLLMIFVGPALAAGGFLHLKGLENIDHLVTGGIYAVLRHPMYTGFILWIAGWILYRGAGISILPGIAAIADILYWRHLEERKLEAQFGEKYAEYRRKTWF